ncbi:hypothetical protein [Chitinasiproducens palmae]|uniref:Uncharacterized protein n=1 Tax=Chitinasiproducens palmae TaxID=1770053 RepID=A0A1H2PQP0_9BURK|nr:hypothetical protein [Chitinasiproducens palmae]SDV49160.1 hypothetical protein SAMN05216551_107115 [Chitinasiproducens palmae]
MNRYRREMTIAMVAYVVCLAISVTLLLSSAVDSQLARVAVALLPMVPGIGVCWVVVRRMRRIDELQRRIELESLSIAFAGTALVTFSYGFLENVGFPRLSLFVVWPLMGALWIVASVLCSRRYR